ncbi:aldo/keto reductase [Cryobacterium tepidiphilum]|uniref:Aldo/keto reductase n=1 Tax=Cryobacterium tepidiphilum TaxID=2486026 RepID=A0A3M8LMG0_9MICO|nr:aldo/keto reductase [Cryobacterium tepidiphilum]RNE66717.1 aldo/keto reductase [Cryobacterium tepidiphilum]
MTPASTSGATVPRLTLNTGASIPQLGLGVFQVPPEDTRGVVTAGLSAGYRSIDTAARYQNEAGVGEAIAESSVPRDEVFVTTKLANDDQGYDQAHVAFNDSLEELGLDAVDLYLIHWPAPKRGEYLNCWRAFEEFHRAGRARAIGVSNFLVPHLERLLENAHTVPAVNQIELHPYLQQQELRTFHAEHGILTEAWSPLAQGAVLNDPVIVGIAERLGRSPAQVVLRWHIQLGTVVIPKSVTPARQAENIDVFDFELDEQAMAQIAGLDRGERTGFHPDEFNGFPEDFQKR